MHIVRKAFCSLSHFGRSGFPKTASIIFVIEF